MGNSPSIIYHRDISLTLHDTDIFLTCWWFSTENPPQLHYSSTLKIAQRSKTRTPSEPPKKSHHFYPSKSSKFTPKPPYFYIFLPWKSSKIIQVGWWTTIFYHENHPRSPQNHRFYHENHPSGWCLPLKLPQKTRGDSGADLVPPRWRRPSAGGGAGPADDGAPGLEDWWLKKKASEKYGAPPIINTNLNSMYN